MTIMLPKGTLWGICGVAAILVLGFGSRPGAAQAPAAAQPFANAVEQRAEMIRELREIKELLKEQNALFRATAKDHAGKTK